MIEEASSQQHNQQQNVHHNNNIFKMVFPTKWKPLFVFIQQIMKKYSIKRDWNQCPEYLMKMLTDSMICVPPDAKKQLNDLKQLSFEQTMSQNELVTHVIRSIVVEQSKLYHVNHVLAHGYTLAQQGINSVNCGIECFFPNTVVNIVKGRTWMQLLKYIGDDLMTYLLTYCIILIPLPRDSYLQVAGRPLNKYITNMEDKIKYSTELNANYFFHIKPFQKSLLNKSKKKKQTKKKVTNNVDAMEIDNLELECPVSPIPKVTQSQEHALSGLSALLSPVLLKSSSSSEESKSSKSSVPDPLILSESSSIIIEENGTISIHGSQCGNGDSEFEEYEEPSDKKKRKRKRKRKSRLSNWRRKKQKLDKEQTLELSLQLSADNGKQVQQQLPSSQPVEIEYDRFITQKATTAVTQMDTARTNSVIINPTPIAGPNSIFSRMRSANDILIPRGMVFFSYRIQPIQGFPKNRMYIYSTVALTLLIQSLHRYL
jgi:hypothetical protein